MNDKPLPQGYVHLNPSPVDYTHLCDSCGYDPRQLWSGNFMQGRDESLIIEKRGQLCRDCAEQSAIFTSQLPESMRKRQRK